MQRYMSATPREVAMQTPVTPLKVATHLVTTEEEEDDDDRSEPSNMIKAVETLRPLADSGSS